MKIADLKIGIRLGLLAAFLMFTMLGTGLIGWRTFSEMKAIDLDTIDKATLVEASIDTARTAQVDFKKQVQEWKDTLLRGNDQAMFDKYSQAFAKQSDATQADLRKLKELFGKLGFDTKQVDETLATHLELGSKYSEALKQYDVQNPDSAHIVDKLVKGMDRPPTEKIDGIVAYVLDQSKQLMATRKTESERAYQLGVKLLVIGILAATALGGAMTVFLIRGITVPLWSAVEVAERVALGDLTSEIEVASKDETGQLMGALHKMNDSLVQIVGGVRTSAHAITVAAGEIATGNMDLSARTETQAASLEETAASMDEISSTVKNSAENANQANQLARAASEVAMRGGAVVSEVVSTMESINDSSKKIVDIISVIDGIAFQTNILALNAAVEAARAGEQGRGFAVVAAEVRNLAQRSATAAKEIKELIADSVEKVGTGSKLVDKAGSTMGEVVESIRRVTDIVGEITSAGQEQSQGIEQVHMAITSMDDVTQQNAALVEEAAAAAASLNDQAINLTRAVSVFKLGNETAAAQSQVFSAAPRLAAGGQPASPRPLVAKPAAKSLKVIPGGAGAGTAGDKGRSGKTVRAAEGGDDWEEF